MKICVITPLFAIAGVPLAQIRFARALAARGHDVDLVIGYVDPKYELPDLPEVNVIRWGHQFVRKMLLPFSAYLRRVKPDIVFSAEDHLNSIVLLAAILTRSKAKISGSSRVTPYNTYSNVPFTKRWVLKKLARAVMWRADALTCVSKDMVEQYHQVLQSQRHVCVYNIVDDEKSRLRMNEPVDEDWLVHKQYPVLIAAGSLEPWKGFADLIQAVGELSQRKDVRLIILGDGSLRSELQELVEIQKVSDRVKLLGHVENPLKYFRHADVFVLSSYVEGLPNVLVEAMMCGCTAVSNDCPTGPREVLQDGKYGYLVPMRDPDAMNVSSKGILRAIATGKLVDPVAMAQGIEQALDNPISKELLAQAVQPFEESAVIKRHFEILGLDETA